ncbi:MAG: ATP-dependent DNA helicase RecG, partial [Pseudomonadota bacterium]
MSRRPDLLNPLFAAITSLEGVGDKTAKLLARLGAEKPRDLLFLPPLRIMDRRMRPSIAGVPDGESATILAQVEQHRPGRRPGAPHRVAMLDESGGFELVFFRMREPQLREMLPEGEMRVISGRVETWEGRRQFTHPDHVLKPDAAEALPPFEPVYPSTEGLAPKTLARAAAAALDRAPD